MNRGGALLLACVASSVMLADLPAASQQTRDATAPSRTAVIAGAVTADDSVGAPLRRARVTLKGPDDLTEQTIVTGDDGKFRFQDLTAGRYTLVAAKEAYLTSEYRANEPGRRGVPIVLTPGAQLTDVSVRLVRGSVIAGRVTGLNGQPIGSRYMSVLATRFVKGTRTLAIVEAPGASLNWSTSPMTDDEGYYRIYDLPPGEYVVVVGLQGFWPWTGSWHTTTADEMQRARASASQARPSAVASLPNPIHMPFPVGPPISNPDDSPQFAPVYYPGTTVASEAQRITLGRSEERDGVDLQLMLTRTAGISGSVVEPSGKVRTVVVQILNSEPQVSGAQGSSTVTPLVDGKFRRPGLAPGRYTVEARTFTNGAGGSAPDQAPAFARADVMLAGQDVTGLTLTLQPTSTVSGRVVIGDVAVTQSVKITLTPENPLEGSWIAPRTVAANGGRFEIADVMPGRYRLSVANPSGVSSTAKALFFGGAVVAGRDVADTPFEVAPNQTVSDVVISMTDEPSRLRGALQDIAAQPALEYSVVVFPIDPAAWHFQSRRIRVEHAASDGSFTFAGLPPGEYALAVVTDLDAGEEFDPAFLQQLLAQAVRVSIADGVTTTQNLRIARAPEPSKSFGHSAGPASAVRWPRGH